MSNRTLRWILVVLITIILPACGGEPLIFVPVEENSILVSPEAAQSTTPLATPTAQLPSDTPTATIPPLPTLIIPTPLATQPIIGIWDGMPTYPTDSVPGFYYRVTFNPNLWAVTEDQFGAPALAHRLITGCVITPATGRGLPPTFRVAHENRMIGTLRFDVNTAFDGDQIQFATYTGGDANIITAFQVKFTEQAEVCLVDAEIVLATLISVPETEATPAP